jgi:uncharacterized membrane protein
MAGIGFELRKVLINERGFPKLMTALKSMFISSGPWIVSILTILTLQVFLKPKMADLEFNRLISIIIYSFVFSLLFSSPIINMVIRHISDQIYLGNEKKIFSIFLAGVLVIGLPSLGMAWGYLTYISDIGDYAITGAYFFTSLSLLWLVMVFVSAMKDFNVSTIAFIIGSMVSVAGMLWMAGEQAIYCLRWYTLGNCISIFILVSRFIQEFGFDLELDFSWLFKKELYPLYFSGLFLNLFPWIDKLLFWFCSENSIELIKGFFFFPAYDFAVFVSYLAIIPTVAYFTVFVETIFHESQVEFLQCIENGGDLDEINHRASQVYYTFLKCIYHTAVFQIFISLIYMLIVYAVCDQFTLAFEILPVLRICVVNATLQVVFQTIVVLLYYFDYQKEVLFISGLGCILTGFITWYLLSASWEYTGYSYFLALILALAAAMVLSIYKIKNMLYYIFNQSGLE